LGDDEARCVRLSNLFSVTTGLWLLLCALALTRYLPSSGFLVFIDSTFPLVWLLTIEFNRRHWHLAAKIYLGVSCLVCVGLNSIQMGRASENHLIFLMVGVAAFYIFPLSQLRYIVGFAVASIGCMVGAEFFLSTHAPIVSAPPDFFTGMRLISLYALAALLVLVALLNYQAINRAQAETDAIHRRSEDLLLNVLPPSIAARLKAFPGVIASRAESVTIVFADIVDFAARTAALPPEEIVALLNSVFVELDRLCLRFGLEKIKTMGAAYMAVAGIPLPVEDHCDRVAAFALELQRKASEGFWAHASDLRFRLGINTGPVVAGVIGESKFIYDLWGDTVNTASRMESHGQGGEVQVTSRVYETLRDRFHFSPARTVAIKGKDLMEVYFLRGRKSAGAPLAS
jgi:class 3 adenylate cyclase